ncbi:hypothetical protein FE257_011445 [Aspergillus nanangensis]|uniref:DNA-directed RNA polymerase subunit n=1 Tax=Aspergillus nanangensis TaxID=2582783 RepID=A0AAD4CIK4_ASPNN|nr:hypothetical protein FE257_011445 [Aspergillus nanangensis]
MAVDAMEIDSSPIAKAQSPEKERKRKKTKDTSSPSKKKRKHEQALTEGTEKKTKKSKSKDTPAKASSKPKPKNDDPSSPYALTTATLYLPLAPISISPTHALASLLAEHLSPLLLTYYPPLQGVVMAYSNASISSTPPRSPKPADPQDPNPQPLTLANSAGEYGVLYVYLTATFLVFRPRRGQILEGWINVQSEGFLGAVVLNLFSVGIERQRLPTTWKWVPPGDGEGEATTNHDSEKLKNEDDSSSSASSGKSSASFNPDKEYFTPVSAAADADADEDEDAGAEGYFRSVSGHRVRGTVRFRVVDVDIIPGSDRERGFLSIEGTMLTPEEEAKLVEDERNGAIASFAASRRGSSPGTAMSGALVVPGADEQSQTTVETIEIPEKSKESKPEKEKKKSKSKSKSKKEK